MAVPETVELCNTHHVWKQEGQGLSLGLGWVSLAAWVHLTALGTGRGWNAGKSSGRCPALSPTLAAGAEEGFLLLQHCSRRCLLKNKPHRRKAHKNWFWASDFMQDKTQSSSNQSTILASQNSTWRTACMQSSWKYFKWVLYIYISQIYIKGNFNSVATMKLINLKQLALQVIFLGLQHSKLCFFFRRLGRGSQDICYL